MSGFNYRYTKTASSITKNNKF